ncbi:uncharacterized protein B0H18DRAFT_890469 [Fomitopsis serialis]|uniref:uncharacterized protein n=1 Tax=Fomitopsis serialis TaxID=139415 RepID=UPI0020088BAC|nr:uncharacterized protein B0H18DRAFT_890469 [Neoantrodia serialis]KAH9912228.1 hypothetical protein B0H18DRAFT_890469 [Neoantrodia serialis]
MHRTIAHIQRRASVAGRRTACHARALSASALAPEGHHDASDPSLLLDSSLKTTARAQKPSHAVPLRGEGSHGSHARQIAQSLRRHAPARPVVFSPSPSSSGQDPAPNPEPENNGDGEISDQEWEIRTGRAIWILQQTLPAFFHTGLVTSLETPLVARPPASESPEGAERGTADPHCGGRPARPDGDSESIYSRAVRLAYTPPHALPPPFPRTLTLEGSALYLASSAFVRHTLNALYTDLTVRTTRVRVLGPGSSSGGEQDPHGRAPRAPQKQRALREKSLFLGLSVSGVARVSGARGGWDVNSTYTFSPQTGLIHLHQIDSIEPAPTQAVFDALRAALAKLGLAGADDGAQAPGAPGAARAQPIPASVRAASS